MILKHGFKKALLCTVRDEDKMYLKEKAVWMLVKVEEKSRFTMSDVWHS